MDYEREITYVPVSERFPHGHLLTQKYEREAYDDRQNSSLGLGVAIIIL